MNPHAITVRCGGPQDGAFIATLGKRTVIDSVPSTRHAKPADVLGNYERLLDIVERQSHRIFIAQRGEAPIGFLLAVDDLTDEVTGEPQRFIAYMAVDPAQRQLGVGALLLTAAENEARERGLPYITLMVTDENIAARTLYERNGFVTERRLLCKAL